MKFSIITPSFNQAAYLRDCLESVVENAKCEMRNAKFEMRREQDSKAGKPCGGLQVEHIVMDGGSTDGTVEVLENWKAESRKQKTEGYTFDYVSGPDGGQTEGINRGMARATGEILAYLCSDDFYEPGALARVARVFEAHPEADFVYGDYFFLEGDSGWKRRKKAGCFDGRRLMWNNFLGQPAVFWRRDIWERLGPLQVDLRYCMDYAFWLKCVHARWEYLPEPLATMRQHAEAKTSASLGAMWREAARLRADQGAGLRGWAQAAWMSGPGGWYFLIKRKAFRAWGRRMCRG